MKKRGGITRPSTYQPSNSAMKATTRDFLRQAALAALQAKDDSAALELLCMMPGTDEVPEPKQEQETSVAALPPAKEVQDGPAHDYHYWMQFIREKFIPFIVENGRIQFTSYEALRWIENCGHLPLTTGDVEQYQNGNTVWRALASNALIALKKQGILTAPRYAKDYTIVEAMPQQKMLSVG